MSFCFCFFFFGPKDRTNKHVLCTVSNIFSLSLLCFFNFPRTWRLAAYRQFTWWAHGALGKKNRRVIPACVVKAIRHEFPDETGQYAGFKEAELELS